MASIGLEKSLRCSFDEALAQVPEALKAEGFGVLTEIDVRDTVKKKLGEDFRRYRILGACNPPFAHQALTIDLHAGLMMPCNVVVYEGDDGKAVAMAIDPMQTMAAASDPRLGALACTVKEKLERVLARLK
jgi:uncharacterized protein (DUF302 family)